MIEPAPQPFECANPVDLDCLTDSRALSLRAALSAAEGRRGNLSDWCEGLLRRFAPRNDTYLPLTLGNQPEPEKLTASRRGVKSSAVEQVGQRGGTRGAGVSLGPSACNAAARAFKCRLNTACQAKIYGSEYLAAV